RHTSGDGFQHLPLHRLREDHRVGEGGGRRARVRKREAMNDGTPVKPQDIAPVKSIGVPTPLVDGPEKVSGKALFTADFVDRHALVGRILRSPVAHANIVSIDTSAAEALPGVEAVIT